MKKQFTVFAILITAFVLSGCSDAETSGVISSPTTNTGGSATTTSLINKVVSVGAGINFNAQTGSWSQLAIDPVLKTPGVVYYDRSASVSSVAGIIGALKYAKMNAYGAWDVEVVDVNSPFNAASTACGNAATPAACVGAQNVAALTVAQPQIYDIGFLNYSVNAQPVIAYAYGTGGVAGTTTGKSIRVATRSASGWTVETAVSGSAIVTLTGGAGPLIAVSTEYPIRGVRVLVDDSNRVHVYFGVYSATITNSVYAYVMKKTDGTWTTPVAVATTSPSALAFASGAITLGLAGGMNQAGAAWCKYNSGGSSSDGVNALISIGVTEAAPNPSTKGFMLRCSTANADGACTAWQGLNLVTGCAGVCLPTAPAIVAGTVNHFGRSDLTVDPVTGRAIVNYFHAAPSFTAPAGAGIGTSRSPAACDGGLTTTVWPTVRYHPAVAQGTLGLKAATDGTDVVMASLAAATGTSVVANKVATALATNWNATPDQIAIEAPAAGPVFIGGGMAYDSSTQVFWGSFGAVTAGGAGAAGQDLKVFSLYSGDVSISGAPISTSYVDQTNTVANSVAVPMLDAAKAPNGIYGYAYFYQEPGGAQGVNSHLYYGTRGGTALSPVFGEKMVSSALQGLTTVTNGIYPSLAYDSQSNPVISFLDQGTVAATGYLILARSANGGTSFSLDRVDGSNVTTNNVGQYSSAAVTSSDSIGVSYYDYSTGATGQRLKFAKRTKTGAWRRYIVDGPGSAGANGCTTTASATTGLFSRLKWTSTGRPVIVYQSQVSGVKSLRLAYATEAETSATYTWTCLTLDTALQGSNTRGEGIDFVLSSADLPYIAHYDSGIGALRVVTCASAVLSCSASNYTGERPNYIIGTVQSIASRPGIEVTPSGKIIVSFHGAADQGLYYASKENGAWTSSPTLVEGTPAGSNGVLTGTHAVLMLNSANEPAMFYRSYENWIKYFSKEIH